MPKSKEYISSSGSESDEERPKKKQKKEKDKPKKDASKSSISKEEDTMLQLSKMRYVSVSEFRGKKYVNIREYYEQDGDLKPGRKGIALNEEQWKKLKDHITEIDEQLDAV